MFYLLVRTFNVIFLFFKARDLRNLKILSNPAHPTARHILSERYGVALPHIVDKHEQAAQVCKLN